jgi:nitrogen regulatory protein PII
MIEVLLRPHLVDDVVQALHQVQVPGLTVSEARTLLPSGGPDVHYRGSINPIGFIHQVKLEIAVPDGNAYAVQQVIHRRLQSQTDGAGVFQVRRLEAVIRIRTGEKGDAAV